MSAEHIHYDPELLSRFLADRQERVQESNAPAAQGKRIHWSDILLVAGLAAAVVLAIAGIAARPAPEAAASTIIFNWNVQN